MTNVPSATSQIATIPIDQIHIINPRARNHRIFIEMVDNIAKVGLKRPITVTPTKTKQGEYVYDLVCGQGRIEAFQSCGQTHIPAIVIDASQEDTLVMSLVENLARRQHRPLDILRGIEMLEQRGYDIDTIAAKTGLSPSYTKSILHLLAKGEERLLAAVELGHIPISAAKVIVEASPGEEQNALQDAYENGLLKGYKLRMAKQLLESRQKHGKEFKQGVRKPASPKPISADDVLAVYQKEVDRKRHITRKAELVTQRMAFIAEALKQLYQDDAFASILEAQELTSLPKPLQNYIQDSS